VGCEASSLRRYSFSSASFIFLLEQPFLPFYRRLGLDRAKMPHCRSYFKRRLFRIEVSFLPFDNDLKVKILFALSLPRRHPADRDMKAIKANVGGVI